MNSPRNLLTAALAFGCFNNVLAADSATLTVTGSIKPVACIPQFNSGATIDYGDVTSLLKYDKETNLALKDVSFKIDCPSKIRVAFKAIDARMGSGDDTSFGLGLNKESSVGRFSIMLGIDHSGDGKNAAILTSLDKGQWVIAKTKGGTIKPNNLYTLSTSNTSDGSTAPGAYQTHQYDFDAHATISPTRNLDMANEIKLDGSLIFELNYL